MFKKITLSLCIALLLAACKKEGKPVRYNVIGKWYLYSVQSTKQYVLFNVNANITQYPCVANNILTLNADGTASFFYTGDSTCYINPGTPFDPLSFGRPGLLPIISTWSVNGNKLYLGKDGNTPGIINTVNGQLQVTLIDTINLTSKYIKIP